MNFELILARSTDGTIGLEDGSLPWRQKRDMQNFKDITTGHVMVVGRTTWDTFKNRPLKNRTTIVMTHDPVKASADYLLSLGQDHKFPKYPPVIFVEHLDALHVDMLNPEHFLDSSNKPKPTMIIGGASIYRYALSELNVTRIHLTEIVIDLIGEKNVRFTDTFDKFQDRPQHATPTYGIADENHNPYRFRTLVLKSNVL